MSRQDKGSRLRRLPPSVQLQLRDAITGSYPVTSRFSTDGRTGIYNTHFDDQRTVVFTSSNIYFTSYGLPGDSIYLGAYERFAQELSGTMTAVMTTGSVRSQVVEGMPYMTFPIGQELTPFCDNAQPAADGKSSNNVFFTTGSADLLVGGGFSSPLWSKNKIEIDLTPSADHTVGIRASASIGGTQDNFIMSYWNHDTRTWTGVGPGYALNRYEGSVAGSEPLQMYRLFDEVATGFGGTIGRNTASAIRTGLSASSKMMGEPISNFGFPFHEKYHATSSNTINLSEYINAPFLLEKIVLSLSCALDLRDSGSESITFPYWLSGSANYSSSTITTFFLLNQREHSPAGGKRITTSIDYSSGSDPATAAITPEHPGTITSLISSSYCGNSTRDLITWLQISKTADLLPGNSIYKTGLIREFNYTVPTTVHGNYKQVHFDQQLIISGTVKLPISYARGMYIHVDNPVYVNVNDSTSRASAQYFESWFKSGRNCTGNNGRDYINSAITPEPIGLARLVGNQGDWLNYESHTALSYDIVVNKTYEKQNPYLMLPTDKLIIGCNLPTSDRNFIRTSDVGEPYLYSLGQVSSSNNQLGPALSFSMNGVNKIILYGSYISNDKEHNDGTNQLLSSDSVHEVVGEG